MAANDDIYVKLSEKIGVVGYPRYVKILSLQMKPEEATLAVGLADGKTPDELSATLKVDKLKLASMVEELVKGRFVNRTKDGKYTIPVMPRFFPRINNTPELKKLWYEFFHSGDYYTIDVEHMKKRAVRRGALRSHKIIPAHQALLASPNIKKENILWYEDMEGIFRRSGSISQGGYRPDGTMGTKYESDCGCRRYWGSCDAPGGCTGWSWKPGEWGLTAGEELPFGGRHTVTIEQAMDACNRMEDWGLIHLSPNTAQITSTCNCCECCCEIIHGYKELANIWELLAPSRYLAVIDQEKCTGCQTCIERCHFDAVEMKSVPGSKKMKAFILKEHCMGCGLCIFKCPSQAMHLEVIRPPEHIPTITVAELFGRGQ